ncbi:unnamed protein product [marine sediment metagenome]|uniref:Uncharacterized protein n=1 Tax=marine sediment metagenome TaxID=412755 RepID=X1S1C6_9ZZZZ
MPKEPAERYMEWLEREEERLGIAATQRASMDIEEAREMLYEELGYDPTESQLSTFMELGKARYEIMPEIGITAYRFERPYGYQMVYQDVKTTLFISYAETTERIKMGWGEWRY